MVPVTDIGPDDGGTLVLEGSHKLEGAGISDLRQCPVAQIEAPRGSVVYFPETLMHTAVPILSETRRYVMFYAYVPPWFEVWHGGEVPNWAAVFAYLAASVVVGIGADVEGQPILHDLAQQGLDAFGHPGPSMGNFSSMTIRG
jgi:hypothetical protein